MASEPVVNLLTSILLFSGYLFIAQQVCSKAPSPRLKPALAIVTLFTYLCFVGFVALIYQFFSYDPLVLYIALSIFAVGALVYVLRGCVKHWDGFNRRALIVFIGYGTLILYVTILMRIGTVTDTTIRMQPFERLIKVMETGSLAPIGHDCLNAMMFVPIGILIPLIHRDLFGKVSYAFLFGMIAATAIEMIQYATHLGECDINDAIFNTLGAVIGYGLYAVYRYMISKRQA